MSLSAQEWRLFWESEVGEFPTDPNAQSQLRNFGILFGDQVVKRAIAFAESNESLEDSDDVWSFFRATIEMWKRQYLIVAKKKGEATN